MFTKLAKEIDFNDIEAFCREWSEGVRVEYKREVPAKTNSQGHFIFCQYSGRNLHNRC